MSILIEGPNGSGKTYLARELASRLGVPYVHNTKATRVNEYFSQLDTNAIVDRGWLSAPVYEMAEFLAGQPRSQLLTWDAAEIFMPRQILVLLSGVLAVEDHERDPSQNDKVFEAAGHVYDLLHKTWPRNYSQYAYTGTAHSLVIIPHDIPILPGSIDLLETLLDERERVGSREW
jgi:predicted ATPase